MTKVNFNQFLLLVVILAIFSVTFIRIYSLILSNLKEDISNS